VKVAGDDVYLDLPPVEVLDRLLATEIGCALATSCATNGHVAELCAAVGV
jgi:hypothetical protein